MNDKKKSADAVSKQSIHDEKPWLFKPGQSGNPSGKKKGTRNYNPVRDLVEIIAEHKIKIDPKRRKRLGLSVDELTTLENILLDWATSMSPAKQQMFIERLAGKVPNLNINTNQNVEIVMKFKSKFTDSELEAISGGADAMEILFAKLPDVDIEEA